MTTPESDLSRDQWAWWAAVLTAEAPEQREAVYASLQPQPPAADGTVDGRRRYLRTFAKYFVWYEHWLRGTRNGPTLYQMLADVKDAKTGVPTFPTLTKNEVAVMRGRLRTYENERRDLIRPLRGRIPRQSHYVIMNTPPDYWIYVLHIEYQRAQSEVGLPPRFRKLNASAQYPRFLVPTTIEHADLVLTSCKTHGESHDLPIDTLMGMMRSVRTNLGDIPVVHDELTKNGVQITWLEAYAGTPIPTHYFATQGYGGALPIEALTFAAPNAGPYPADPVSYTIDGTQFAKA